MHLINCSTRQLEEFIGSNIPRYAILSHTWGEGEVSYADMKNDHAASRLKEGYRKIDFTCEQALLNGLDYAWVDTCSIDKSSSVELSEAINSMFRWYEDSAICYVYLSDVEGACWREDLPRSRWFTRGWTLQELLAPEHVTFYDCRWTQLGTKDELAGLLHSITNIDQEALVHTGNIDALDQFCVAQKMSWASNRQTTREEDTAYSLMGIFNVTMPLLYGEGIKAFQRLQEAIITQSGDHSILAWNLDTELKTLPESSDVTDLPTYVSHTTVLPNYLAGSPRAFAKCGQLRHAPRHQVKMEVTNLGLQIEVPLLQVRIDKSSGMKIWLALLSCLLEESSRFVGIMLSSVQGTTFVERLYYPVSLAKNFTHATTVNARAVAESSLQNITIVSYTSNRLHDIFAPMEFTNIVMFPTGAFSAARLCVKDAKVIFLHKETPWYPPEAEQVSWDPENNELIVKNFGLDGIHAHGWHIILWIAHAEDLSSPLYRIQLCTTCGVYNETKWHKDLRYIHSLSDGSHVASTQMSFPKSDCIFKIKVTKKDLCQRNFIMVDVDLGIQAWQLFALHSIDNDGRGP